MKAFFSYIMLISSKLVNKKAEFQFLINPGDTENPAFSTLEPILPWYNFTLRKRLKGAAQEFQLSAAFSFIQFLSVARRVLKSAHMQRCISVDGVIKTRTARRAETKMELIRKLRLVCVRRGSCRLCFHKKRARAALFLSCVILSL